MIPCVMNVILGLLDFSPEEIRLEAYNANAEGKADRYVRWSISGFYFNPLHFNISMLIIHTVLYTFPMLLTRRICFTSKSFIRQSIP